MAKKDTTSFEQKLFKASVGIVGTKYKPLDNSFQLKEALKNMIKLINNKQFFLKKHFYHLS